MAIADPSTYALLPAGTRVLWGATDSAQDSMQLLKDADAVGVTGKDATFQEVTRLIDTESKYIAGLAEGPDKEFVFVDDPSDAALQGLLDAAEAKETVKIRIEFPNSRWAEMTVALGGWSHQELDKASAMKLVVKGKQNGIERGVMAA